MVSRKWLVDLRNGLGYTQEQVARLAGIERSTYTKIENGNSISVKTAKKIANALNFDWTIFFKNECDETGQGEKLA